MGMTVEKYSFSFSVAEMREFVKKAPSQARVKFCEFVGTKNQPGKPRELRDYLIQKLTTFDQTVIDRIPTWIFQEAIDGFLSASRIKAEGIKKYIHEELGKITFLQPFLHTDEGEHWVQQCAIFLVKLPFNIIANIFSLFLNILAASIYTVAHPLKALNELMKFAVNSIYGLTKPKTWSTMGVGMIGASFGQMISSGNPISLLGILTGCAMIAGGLSAGSLSAAIKAESGERLKAVQEQLWKQISPLPGSFIRGACMGVLLGGIQQIFKGTSPVENHVRKAVSMIPTDPKQNENLSSTTQVAEIH